MCLFKGSLEMDLPAQVGEVLIFTEHCVCFCHWKKTVVKGGWNYYLCFYTWLVGECIFAYIKHKNWEIFTNNSFYYYYVVLMTVISFYSLSNIDGQWQVLIQTTWIQTLPMLLTGCVALSKLPSLCVLSFHFGMDMVTVMIIILFPLFFNITEWATYGKNPPAS